MGKIFETTIRVLGWREIKEEYKKPNGPSYEIFVEEGDSLLLHQSYTGELTEVPIAKTDKMKSFVKIPAGEKRVRLEFKLYTQDQKAKSSFWIHEVVED